MIEHPDRMIVYLSGGLLDQLEPWKGTLDEAIEHLEKQDWNPEDDDFQILKFENGEWLHSWHRDPDEDCEKCYKHKNHCTCK